MLKFPSSRFVLIFVVALLAFHSVGTANINQGEGNTDEEDPIDIATRASKCQLPNYTSFKGRHYYFSTDLELSQPDASIHCQKINMELVSIEDCEEDRYLTNMIKDYGQACFSKDYWTSGYRKNNNFYWGTEAPMTYTNWKYDEPNNVHKNEDCVDIRAFYMQFNDEPCDHRCRFICESANSPNIK